MSVLTAVNAADPDMPENGFYEIFKLLSNVTNRTAEHNATTILFHGQKNQKT